MKRLFGALFFIALGGGLVLLSFHFHVVRAAGGHLVVRRSQPAMKDVYVDVRKWTASDWQEHPDLIRAVRAKGRGDLIVKPKERQPLRNFLRNFR